MTSQANQDHPGNDFPGDEAILDAIEQADEAAFESIVATIRDEALAARVRAMRADRAALISARPEPAPVELLTNSFEEAFTGADADVLARLEESAPSSLGGPPVSGVQPYREPVLARLWRVRRELGVALAAGLVLAAGAGITVGVRSLLESRGEAGPAIAQAEPSVEVNEPAPQNETAIVQAEPADEIQWPVAPEAPAAWDAGALASVFDAARLIETGRLVVYARSSSSARLQEAMDAMGEQRIGPDHAFEVAPGLPEGVLASIGMPIAEAPVVVSEEGVPLPEVTVERSSWTARVRPTSAALAALRKRLEEAGMTVEFRELLEPLPELAERPAPDQPASDQDGDAGERPGIRGRASSIPVVIDTLP